MIWINWLSAVTVIYVLAGLIFVFFSDLTSAVFSLVLYGNTKELLSLDPKLLQYTQLIHAILGAVIAAWGLAMFLIVRKLIAKGDRLGLNYLAASLLIWFVLDTSYSLYSGFWQNAIFNLAFFVPLAVGLMGCWLSGKHSTNNIS